MIIELYASPYVNPADRKISRHIPKIHQPKKPSKVHRTKQVYEGYHQIVTPQNRVPLYSVLESRGNLWPQYSRIESELDTSLSDQPYNSKSVDTRLAICASLATPATFVYVLLRQFAPDVKNIPNDHVDILYSDFCKFVLNKSIPCARRPSISVSTRAEFPYLEPIVRQFSETKSRYQDMKSIINQSGIFNSNMKSIVIHRIEGRPEISNSQSLGKKNYFALS